MPNIQSLFLMNEKMAKIFSKYILLESYYFSDMKNKKITVGSLFAGIGGFCKAFELEGAKVLWANDIDKYVEKTYRFNYENKFIRKNIEELSVNNDKLEQVDILTAGFPCQPFSIAGYQKGYDDPRGNVFYEITRLIKEFGKNKPKILLLENVKNFGQDKFLLPVIKELNKVGYWFDRDFAQILNTAELTALPQNRERLFMIALNKDYFENIPLPFPEEKPINKIEPYKFMDTKGKVDDSYYFKPQTKYWKLFKEKMEIHESEKKKNIYLLRRWYVRPYLNGATPTLTANMGTGGHNVPVLQDDWGIRKLTLRECAELQGFSKDWFQFPPDVSRGQIYKQIGNAVTVPVVQKLARLCINALKNLK